MARGWRNRRGGRLVEDSRRSVTRRYAVRIRPWLRFTLLAAAVTAVAVCLPWVQHQLARTAEYRDAPLCPAGRSGPADDCVERSAERVAETATSRSCTTMWTVGGASEGTTVGSAGGTVQGATAGNDPPITTCSDSYRLRLRGSERWLDIEKGTYDDVRRGDRAQVRTWRGTVVELRVRGHTEEFLAPEEWVALLRLAVLWLAALTAGWVVVSGSLVSLWWLLLTLPCTFASFFVLL